jgi:hypothetical protein
MTREETAGIPHHGHNEAAGGEMKLTAEVGRHRFYAQKPLSKVRISNTLKHEMADEDVACEPRK